MQIGEFIPKLDLASISFPLLPFRYPPSVSWQSLCIFNIQILLIYPSVHCSSCVLWPRVDCSGRCSSRANQELILLTLLEHRNPPKPRNSPKAPVATRNGVCWVEGAGGKDFSSDFCPCVVTSCSLPQPCNEHRNCHQDFPFLPSEAQCCTEPPKSEGSYTSQHLLQIRLQAKDKIQ